MIFLADYRDGGVRMEELVMTRYEEALIFHQRAVLVSCALVYAVYLMLVRSRALLACS